MASINVEIRERKEVVRKLRQQERFIDTAQEVIQRVFKAIEARKRKVPELADIMKVLSLVGMLSGLVDAFADKVSAAAEMFGDMATEADRAGLRQIGIDLGVVKGENVLAYDPSLIDSYIKLIFKNEKNLQEWIDANPQYRDTVIGTGSSANNIKWGR